ncbi:L,D-transpeptidase [Undibacterium sp.]|jgi:lipoprotein-anchoring transpeptidase ErfK/SrfK|uniref:L,D-transpeptidase n=1 Tax=Undibacterium sp. TaxID=1914977 RepID=UPI002D1104FE|nr:L,D-transpeptidase [Undibacterium sp.]HTD07042.1 L,D-transpeptidase [Undibacterium sp.]
MKRAIKKAAWMSLGMALLVLTQTACTTLDTSHQLIVSVPEQKMVLLEKGVPVAWYPVSTAQKGIGDVPDSYQTPGGRMEIAEKIGAGSAIGTVFKNRKPTGEVVAPDSPGRDPVVTRILWLRGLEEQNRHAYERFIYIHGTPQESLLGNPASYGCIRMRSADVAELFERVGVGAQVVVSDRTVEQAIELSKAPPPRG